MYTAMKNWRAGVVCLLAALALGGCGGSSLFGGSKRQAAPPVDPNAFPANYRQQIATMLTTVLTNRADFHGADLTNTGLADIEWEGADLRRADLRGASFHAGTTRCGLVGSLTPSEGTRTGFYTDDFNDRDYKPPEEIRKASLRDADLRGAKIDGVDFYLVDLRGARYTRGQGKWFRKCGAIL